MWLSFDGHDQEELKIEITRVIHINKEMNSRTFYIMHYKGHCDAFFHKKIKT